MHKKLIILVLAADIPIYNALVQKIKETWGAKKMDGVEILYYHGFQSIYKNPEKDKVVQYGDTLVCGVDEGIANIFHRTILAYQYILDNYDFEYSFRCCSGSYVSQIDLLNFLETIQKRNIYCGARLLFKDVEYVSGANLLMSRDAVDALCKNVHRARKDIQWDDVLIGDIMNKVEIPICDCGRRVEMGDNLYQITEGDKQINELDMTPRLVKGHYHYHFRTSLEILEAFHKLHS